MSWFDQEKQLATAEGVSHPLNFPYLLEPAEAGERAVILIHGFGSSPRELLCIGQQLQRQGITAYGVRLPGHGTSPEDLATRDMEDWFACCERGFLNLAQSHPRVGCIGISTGALLGAKLALKHQPYRLALLSPFLKLKHPLASFAGLLSLMIPYQENKAVAEDHPFHYRHRPLKGVWQINRLRRQLRKQLTELTAPTLVLAAEGDAVIAHGTAQDLYNRLGSVHKEYYAYGANVPHALTSDSNPEREDVIERCVKFLLG